MSPHSSVHQHTGIDDLPVEFFEEIISHLNIPSIKSLSRTSSTLRTICFPHVFRTLLFSRHKSSTFHGDFKGCTPTPCFRTIELTFVNDNISTSLLPWCTRAHTVRISVTNLRNTAILPSLSVLRELELSYVTFWVVDDYFRFLGNLPPTLKRLKAHGINFRLSTPPFVEGLLWSIWILIKLRTCQCSLETAVQSLSHPCEWHLFHNAVRMILRISSRGLPVSLTGQENSAFDICMDAFNCVRLRLREFNLHSFVGPSMHLDAPYPDSQYHFNDTG